MKQFQASEQHNSPEMAMVYSKIEMTTIEPCQALSFYGECCTLLFVVANKQRNEDYIDHELCVIYIADVQWLCGIEWRLDPMPESRQICAGLSLNKLCLDRLWFSNGLKTVQWYKAKIFKWVGLSFYKPQKGFFQIFCEPFNLHWKMIGDCTPLWIYKKSEQGSWLSESTLSTIRGIQWAPRKMIPSKISF